MHEVYFGEKDGPCSYFEDSIDLIAVRSRLSNAMYSPVAPVASCTALSGCEVVVSLDDVGVQILRVPTGSDSVGARKALLDADPDIQFAGTALVTKESKTPVLYTENLFIKFFDGLSVERCERLLKDAGVQIKRKVSYAANAYVGALPEGSGVKVFTVARNLLANVDVQFCHPEILFQGQLRTIHPNQWHLKKTIVTYSEEVNASANVEAAHQWSTGKGVTIAVLDSEFDIDHPEFSMPGKIVAPVSFGGTRPNDNPRYRSGDVPHGTAVAGVACAGGTHGASGVAPDANLMPIRITLPMMGSLYEADAFEWARTNGADIISCSWGPIDPRMPKSTDLAIRLAATQGRHGCGCLIFFASGNDNKNVRGDPYVTHEEVIAVAASNDTGVRSHYSNFGHEVFCAFPSDDGGDGGPMVQSTRGIWTTTIDGEPGRTMLARGDKPNRIEAFYSSRFGGTSSACPGAAGVAALILSVNPVLLGAQVRDILRQTCDKITSEGSDDPREKYDASGHSHFYGYGRLNAGNAVLEARKTLMPRSVEAPAEA